jgi:hypothetical protein
MSLSMVLGLVLAVVGSFMWRATKGPPDDLEYHTLVEGVPAAG